MDEHSDQEVNRATKSPETLPNMPNTPCVDQACEEPRCASPQPSETSQPSGGCTNSPQLITSDDSPGQLEEQVQREQQLPQQPRDLEHFGEEQDPSDNLPSPQSQSPNLHPLLSTTYASGTHHIPATASQPEASVPTATANQPTQTACPPPVFQGPYTTTAPSRTIPTAANPFISSAPLGTNPVAPRDFPATTFPALPGTGLQGVPTTAPPGPPGPPHQHFNPSQKIPSTMAAANGWTPFAQSLFCPPPHLQQVQQQQPQQAQPQPAYWAYPPGTVPAPAANFRQNHTGQSPWYSGTAHYLTNPPPPQPQVYSVQPAYIMPQAAYYQAAAPAPPAAPVYYYVAGQPCYYYV